MTNLVPESIRPEFMYIAKSFTPDQQDEIIQTCPSNARQAMKDLRRENKGFFISTIPLDSFLDPSLSDSERDTLKNKFSIKVDPHRMVVSCGDENTMLYLDDHENGKINLLVANLSSSMISVLYDELRQSSMFFRKLFEFAVIPQKDPGVISRAEIVQERDRKERERLALIQPEQTGICRSIPVHELDINATTVVGQQGYAYGHPRIVTGRILQTYGLADCVALVGYNSDNKMGFLAHISVSETVPDAFALIRQRLGESVNLVVYGGRGNKADNNQFDGGVSRRVLATIKDQLKIYKTFTVVGQDTLGNKSRSIALDTESGEIFIPKQIKAVDYAKDTIITLRSLSNALENDGPQPPVLNQINAE